jgi:hypothetical protein
MLSRRVASALFLALVLLGSISAAGATTAEESEGPVTPDPAFLEGVPGGKCTPETKYEKAQYSNSAAYGSKCKRINFAYGPIHVKPGQNDVALEPVDIEQPRYDGYIVRFKPDLVRALDGGHPRTEDLHLHHATWLNLGDSYGDGPFFAAGEEKTIANFPKGYGMEVKADDAWGLLYMVHNATAQPESVWLTYQIDYVAKEDAKKLGIVPVKPLWLDVQKNQIHKDAPDTSSNPVFNAQRGFGHIDRETGTRVCRWPDENCARHDMYGNVSPQQGRPIKIRGQDYRVPKDMAGTIVGLGGHLHPGGLRDEVSLVRDGREKMIFLSDALYWDYKKPNRVGAPPVSWNMSMTVTGSPLGWKVKIRPGDIIRINAVYDTHKASWYENMGIVVAYVAPKDPYGAPGINPFAKNVTIDRGISNRALTPKGPFHTSGFRPGGCKPDLIGRDGTKRLCLRGQVTHGAVPESGQTGGCANGGCPALPRKNGPIVTDIHSAGFTYANADLGVIGELGVPRVRKGEPLRLWSWDALGKIYHTYTRCKEPCTGPTGVNYPIADGGTGKRTDRMDFDSSEIGYGLLFEPAKSQIGGSDPYDDQWVRDGLYWEFKPNRTGTYAFYCRVHPGMRGAFKVVK